MFAFIKKQISDTCPHFALNYLKDILISIIQTITEGWHKLFFSQAWKMLHIGQKRTLVIEDFPELKIDATPRVCANRLKNLNTQNGVRKFFISVLMAFKSHVIATMALSVIATLLSLSTSLFIKQVLDGIGQQTNYAIMIGIGGLAFVTTIGAMFFQHMIWQFLQLGNNMSAGLSLLVYSKTLKIPRWRKVNKETGDMVSHINSDIEAVSEISYLIGEGIQGVLSFIIGSVLLFMYLGQGTFFSMAVMISIMFVTRLLGGKFMEHENGIMASQDKRSSLIGQIVSGIRVVKYFAWREKVTDEIQTVREQELSHRQALIHLEAKAVMIFVSSFIILGAGMLGAVLSGRELTPADIFAAISVIVILEGTLGMMSFFTITITNASVSAKRLIDFLNEAETDNITSNYGNKIPAIRYTNVSLFHESLGLPVLKNLNFDIQAGELVAICGAVGCGKSTLLLSLMNELPQTEGLITFNRNEVKISYVSQEAFILNSSLKENIIFNGNADKLNEALRITSLEKDIAQMAGGLDTEIGEHGLNLSGGQKQRVALARAYCHDGGLFLLDDPLSAVDSQTEKILVEEYLVKSLQGKTRIVVTHRLEHLAIFDKIIFIENGEIAAVGNFKQLQNNIGFKNFTSSYQHVETKNNNECSPETTDSYIKMNITEAEEREEGAISFNHYLYYIATFLGKTKAQQIRNGIWLLGLAIMSMTLEVLGYRWLASWELYADTPFYALSVYCGINIIFAVVVFIRTLSFGYRGLAASRKLHDDAIKGVLGAPVRFFDSTPIGRILNRLTRDISRIDGSVYQSWSQFVRLSLSTLFSLVLLIGFFWPLAIVALGMSLFQYWLQKLYRNSSRDAQRLQSIYRSPIIAYYKESIEGLVTLRAHRAHNEVYQEFQNKQEIYNRARNGMFLLNRWFTIRTPWISTFLILVTGMGISYLTKHNWMSAGIAGLVLQYALRFWENITFALRNFTELEANMICVERARSYANLVQEKETVATPALTLEDQWLGGGEITFENVHVRYAEHLPEILKGASFSIPAGTRAGIMGRTGAGKSTIFQVLFRFIYPHLGEVKIDGVNIGRIPLERLRSSLAIIPQDPTLFIGTLRTNLDRHQQFTDEEIWQALQKVHMDDFVKSNELGLNTAVQENGLNFSQGQRQLFCLARALLLKARIVIMDEATASVDVQTDALIQEAIREAFNGVTMLIIAHRLSTISDCDMILEVDNGRITTVDRPLSA